MTCKKENQKIVCSRFLIYSSISKVFFAFIFFFVYLLSE